MCVCVPNLSKLRHKLHLNPPLIMWRTWYLSPAGEAPMNQAHSSYDPDTKSAGKCETDTGSASWTLYVDK